MKQYQVEDAYSVTELYDRYTIMNEEELDELAEYWKERSFYDDVDDLMESKGMTQEQAKKRVQEDYETVEPVDYLERVNIYAEEIDE